MKGIKIIGKVILEIVAFPITFCTGFVNGFKGAKEKVNGISTVNGKKYIQYTFNMFYKDILRDLKLNSLPEINLTSLSASYKDTYRLAEFVSPDVFNKEAHLFNKIFKCDRVIRRTDNTDVYINIDINNIYNHMLHIKVLTKFTLIKTIVHELVHYKQYTEARFVGNHSSAFDEYSNERFEIEARKASKKFTIKHFFKIIKFLIFN